ncbi:MAG: NADH-quinone oxidoreductase subunit M [Legionellales bacterium]|nr:NADH-quinone oxidoreductase subunit M [Legionellales bacterium]OUX68251.1 MAG: NADH-quinone oxidoreductase subunit M [bacterium TMED178]
MTGYPLLSILILQSLISAIWIVGSKYQRAQVITYTSTLISILISILIFFQFNPNSFEMQLTESYTWITHWNLNIQLGIDGISLPLILLTVFINAVIITATSSMVNQHITKYWALFFVLQAMVVGVFSANNAFLFYLFWEGMLIPMYLCIGIWGSNLRSYAAIKFFLYTFFGSVLMLLALIYLSIKAGSDNILGFYDLPLSMHEQVLILIAFMFVFAVKVPMWPLHTWLPDAHTEAPAGGSVILAALMLKVGAYGFFRFCLPVTPDACSEYAFVLIGLSLVAIVIIGLVALAQTDMKRLIAYSSVAHMGFVSLGCFIIFPIFKSTGHLPATHLAISGAMMQMITHAFGSGAMFLAFGMLYDQLHSRLIADMGGIAQIMPKFTAFFMVFAFTNIGVPGTAGFVGEFMVLISTLEASVWITLLAGLSLILSASYTLFMFKRVFFGPVIIEHVSHLKDINRSQQIALSVMTAGIFLIGIYPNCITHLMDQTVTHLVQTSLQAKV